MPTPDNHSRTLCETRSRAAAVNCANDRLLPMSAEARVSWALANLPGPHILSSSFGAQAAVSLHLLTQQQADLPVVLIDTGYLFPETYRFVDELTARLDLNLKVYRPAASAAWQEARHGQRWERGLGGIESYNEENKVEPMRRALNELGVRTWFAGLRRSQAGTREALGVVESDGEHWKVHPIIDWTDRDVYDYLTRHELPYHPLWERGYISIGDTHTTRSLHEVENPADTRFLGLKRECGLHELDFGRAADA